MKWNEKLIALLLAVVLIYSGFRFLGAAVSSKNEVSSEDNYTSKTIEYNGTKYFPKQDMETVLFIGVDQEGPVQASEFYENSGMADVLVLVSFDKSSETMDIVSLNRDTMAQIPVRGIDGKPTGSVEGQLALSYAYGDGMEISCENTVEAVSSLLMNTEIDHYVAMNMDGIQILNDAVGGVTVTVNDDFSAVDPSIEVGEVTLKGDQALTFIRARKDVGTQLNISRMERQQEYMENFFLALHDAVSDDASGEFVMSTFEKLSPYMVTDCSAAVLSSMMERYGSYEMGQVQIPEGENRKGEQYMEFYLDEDAFEELVLDTFFVVKD